MQIPDSDGELRLRDLRVFVAAATVGSLSKTAASLGLAQSAMSRQLSTLEKTLGVRLFFRTGRGVALTEAGQELLPRAQALLTQSEQFVDEARGSMSTPKGTVSVGLPPALSSTLAGRLFDLVRERYPAVRLRLHEGYSGEVETWLVDGRIDVGLVNRYRPVQREVEQVLLTTRMMLLGPPKSTLLQASTVPFRALLDLPLVLTTRPNALRSLLDELAARHGRTPDVWLEADSAVILKGALAASNMYSVLPPHAAAEELREGQLAGSTIVEPSIRQTVVLRFSRQRPLSAAARQVARLLAELVARSAQAV